MDAIAPYTGATICPKCCTPAVGAHFCAMDCSRGAGPKGSLYVSEAPALGSAQPPEHQHRVCKGCGYEWLEGCADALESAHELRCGFCMRTRTEIGASSAGGVLVQGTIANICSSCVDPVRQSIKTLRQQTGDASPKQSTQAH